MKIKKIRWSENPLDKFTLTAYALAIISFIAGTILPVFYIFLLINLTLISIAHYSNRYSLWVESDKLIIKKFREPLEEYPFESISKIEITNSNIAKQNNDTLLITFFDLNNEEFYYLTNSKKLLQKTIKAIAIAPQLKDKFIYTNSNSTFTNNLKKHLKA